MGMRRVGTSPRPRGTTYSGGPFAARTFDRSTTRSVSSDFDRGPAGPGQATSAPPEDRPGRARTRLSSLRTAGLLLAGPALAALVALSCESNPSAYTEGALEPIEPQHGWHFVYSTVETCVRRRGDFDRVEWFVADRIVGHDGVESSGIWLVAEGKPHGIALHRRLLDASDVVVSSVVRHEAIHEILQLADHGSLVWCRCDARPERFEQCS